MGTLLLWSSREEAPASQTKKAFVEEVKWGPIPGILDVLKLVPAKLDAQYEGKWLPSNINWLPLGCAPVGDWARN